MSSAIADSTRLSVLIVEDDADSAETLAAMLELCGFGVAVALTGQEAVCKAAIQKPDVVLLDIKLPDINGWEVAGRIRDAATGGPQPVIAALTGFGSERDRARSAHAGIDIHWLKPMPPRELVSALGKFAQLLDRTRPTHHPASIAQFNGRREH